MTEQTRSGEVGGNSTQFVSQVQNLANVQEQTRDKRLQEPGQGEDKEYQLNATGGPLE